LAKDSFEMACCAMLWLRTALKWLASLWLRSAKAGIVLALFYDKCNLAYDGLQINQYLCKQNRQSSLVQHKECKTVEESGNETGNV